jgi:hypothetical protein
MTSTKCASQANRDHNARLVQQVFSYTSTSTPHGSEQARTYRYLDLILAITTYVLQFIATVCALAGSANNHVEF